jgi:DUF4097 and DUF4098 domain-containing protein YvlB
MEQTFATSGQVLVVVENEVGLVAITAREGDTTRVALTAETPGAEELVERAVVEYRPGGGHDIVVIKIPRLHGMKFIRRNGVAVRVDVPLGSDVKVTSASAPVELNGSIGEANVKTASGDVTADKVESLRVKTASGDLEVEAVRGELRLHSASGDLRCVRADGGASVTTASGDVEIDSIGEHTEVRATSGDVRLGEVSGDVTVVSVSGDIDVLSIASGSMHVRSVSGAIELGIARGVTLSVDAESMSGTVDSDIPLSEGPNTSSGGPKVVLTASTVSGDIHVRRGVEAFVR